MQRVHEALAHWAVWRDEPEQQDLSEEERRMCLGPTGTYFVHQEVTVAGQRFVAAVVKGPSEGGTDVASLKNAVFMRGTTNPNIANVHFGVVREVRLFQPVGASGMGSADVYSAGFTQPVLLVDWFARSADLTQRFHAGLNVPVVQPRLMSLADAAAVFESGRLCDPQHIIPIAPILVPQTGKPSQLVVLHRDPDLVELASFDHSWAAW